MPHNAELYSDAHKQLVAEGDRLTAIHFPGDDGAHYQVGKLKVLSIGVCALPGPAGYYLVANVVFEDGRPDLITPLHYLAAFEVLNP